jgi:hypothetical protein
MHKIAYEICKFFPGVIPLDLRQLGATPPDLQGKGKKGGGGKEGREEVRVRGGAEERTRGCPPWLEILATPLLPLSLLPCPH